MGDLKPSEILAKAADLIEPEGAWTQGALARTANDNVIGPLCDPAVCWCANGSLLRSGASDFVFQTAEYRFMQAATGVGEGFISDWNDAPDRTQAEVVAALRRAADLARESEARS